MAKQYQSVDPTLLALNTAKSVLPQTKKQVPASPTTPATSQRPAFPTTPLLQAQSKTFWGITPPFSSPIWASTPQQIGETQQQLNTLPKAIPATGTKKLSMDEFAESIKQKYPQYADRDNKTLAEAMLKKYPQYNDRVEVGTPWFEWLVKTVVWDKTPLQAFITPAVRFARGIADVWAWIQEGIDTWLSKIWLIPSQEAKNKQARAKDEAITQQILWDKGASESVIQEWWRVAWSMIANAPAGKLWTAGKMALGATEWLLGGATYNLSTGEWAWSPINLGLSTALWAAIPWVWALAKGIAEKTPALKNTMAKRLLNSWIKITDTNKKAIVKASWKERTDLALENDIVWSIDDMITKTDEMVDNAMQQKLSTLQSIKETTPVTQTEKLIANSVITQAKRDLEELYWKAFDQITDAEKVPELQDVFNIVNNLQKTIDWGVITPAQKEALKSLYDAYNSHLKYDPAKNRILSGAEKIRLSLQEQIEEIGNKVWVDIKWLNKKIAWGYALKKGLIQAGNRMDNLNMFGLSDSQTAILSAALGGSPLQVVGAIVGKWLLESIPVKSKLAKSLYTKWLNELTSNIPTNRPTARSNISSQFASSNPPSIGGKTDDVKFPIRLKQEWMQTKWATLPKPTVKTPPVIAETGKIGVPYKVPPKTTNKPVGLKANDSKPKVDVFKRFTELDNNAKMEKVNPYNGNYRGDFKWLETEYGKIDSVKFDWRWKPTEFMIDGTIYKPSNVWSYYREKWSKEVIKTAIESKYDNLRSEINKIKKWMWPQAMNLQSILDEFGIDTVNDIPDWALEEILKMTRARKTSLPKLWSKWLPKLGKEVLEQNPVVKDFIYHWWEIDDFTKLSADYKFSNNMDIWKVAAEWPWIYFTSSSKEASWYWNKIIKWLVSDWANIIDDSSKKLTRSQISSVIKKLPKEVKVDIAQNRDENINRWLEQAIDSLVDWDTPHDQLMNIRADVFNRRNVKWFMDVVSKLWIDWVKIKKPSWYHVVVYNKSILDTWRQSLPPLPKKWK